MMRTPRLIDAIWVAPNVGERSKPIPIGDWAQDLYMVAPLDGSSMRVRPMRGLRYRSVIVVGPDAPAEWQRSRLTRTPSPWQGAPLTNLERFPMPDRYEVDVKRPTSADWRTVGHVTNCEQEDGRDQVAFSARYPQNVADNIAGDARDQGLHAQVRDADSGEITNPQPPEPEPEPEPLPEPPVEPVEPLPVDPEPEVPPSEPEPLPPPPEPEPEPIPEPLPEEPATPPSEPEPLPPGPPSEPEVSVDTRKV